MQATADRQRKDRERMTVYTASSSTDQTFVPYLSLIRCGGCCTVWRSFFRGDSTRARSFWRKKAAFFFSLSPLPTVGRQPYASWGVRALFPHVYARTQQCTIQHVPHLSAIYNRLILFIQMRNMYCTAARLNTYVYGRGLISLVNVFAPVHCTFISVFEQHSIASIDLEYGTTLATKENNTLTVPTSIIENVRGKF